MILIIGQTFVNLSPGQVWKAPHNVIDAGTVDDQTDYVVHPNPSALHNCIAPADIGHIDQVTVTSRWHGFTLVRQANLEKAILEAVAAGFDPPAKPNPERIALGGSTIPSSNSD
jgi:hypothetical protein